MSNVAKCMICGSSEAVRRYGVHLDGEPLSLSPLLCSEHGSALVFRAGMLIACISEPIERVFLSERCGFILASCWCEFRKGHDGEHSFEPALRAAATMISISLDEADRQMVLCALARLSIARPGWEVALHAIALQIDNESEGRALMFDNFRAITP